MAYFLKKTNNKKGTYLQIYSSFYDPERRHTAHKTYNLLVMFMSFRQRALTILSPSTKKKLSD